MSGSPPDRCGYTWPENHEIDADPNQQSCCWRETVSDEHDRCVWHVDPGEIAKSAQTLQTARAPPETREQNFEGDHVAPYAELLDGANLSDCQLGDKIPLENVTLRKSVLYGAELSGADIRNTELTRADLRNADLSEAGLRFTRLFRAGLWGTNLSGAGLQFTDLSEADLRTADLSGANLEGAHLSDAKLGHADLSDADLPRVDLSDADLPGVDLSDADLRDADLSDANLGGADLADTNLRSADLSGARFDMTDLSDADLKDADLSGTCFMFSDNSGANLPSVDLSNANLRSADLSETYLRGTDLSGANMRGADLSGANLRGADLTDVDLREANIDGVSVNGTTTCKRLHEGYENKPSTLISLPSIRLTRLIGNSEFESDDWDATARAYYDLKTIFSDHGLVGEDRNKHVQERRARSLEAKVSTKWLNRRYIGSLPSRVFTGHGVRIWYLSIGC